MMLTMYRTSYYIRDIPNKSYDKVRKSRNFSLWEFTIISDRVTSNLHISSYIAPRDKRFGLSDSTRRNYYTDYNQILHSHKDHQILFVGGPNTRKTNPRWRTAAILKIENLLYFQNGLTFTFMTGC